MATIKKIIRALLPPILFLGLKAIAGRFAPPKHEWEYVAADWPADYREGTGWESPDIIKAYRSRWPAFLDSLKGVKPLGLSHESASIDTGSLKDHNLLLTFGYVLATAAGDKKTVSILDWGGGVGHYYLIAKKLLPNRSLSYTIKDTARMCQNGSEFVPEVTFDSTDQCLAQTYDLGFSSASLYYSRDWQLDLRRLAGATGGYLFVTRLPVVQRASSFVAVQHAQRYGYATEYQGWCINQTELLEAARGAGLELIQEFITGERVVIYNAPEPCQVRGYLFKPKRQ